MAMARSSLKGMWSFSCEGGSHLYTQAKMGASFMFQTWRRGLICLLVLVSLPCLAPMIIVTMMVGGIFLVPLLCGVAVYYALFRPALLNIKKWHRSPKSVLRSEPQYKELVMEDPTSSASSNRESVKEGPAHAIALIDTVPEHSLPVEETVGNEAILEEANKDAADSSIAGIAAEKEDSAVGVPSSKELAMDEEIMEDKDIVLHGRDGRARKEDNRPSDTLLSQELVEAKSPLEESGEHFTDFSYPVAETQDFDSEEAENNAFHFDDQGREPGDDQSMTVESPDQHSLEDEIPILGITASGTPLEELNLPADKEEPSQVKDVDNQQEQLEEPEQLDGGLPEEATEERLPDDPAALHVITEDEVPILQEKGIDISFVVSESVLEEKEVRAVEEEDVAAPSLEAKVSMMEQHYLPVESEPVELASPVEDVPAIAEAAPVPEAVSASASVEESDAKDVEVPDAPTGEEKEKADPVLESSASILDQQSLPVHSEPVELASSVMDIPAIAETAHVQEAAALVEEFDAKEAEVPEVPEVSEPVLEEKEVRAVEEEDVAVPSLEAKVSMMEQHYLPVESEPVELASPVEDVPAIAEAAPVPEAVSASASVEESDAKDVEVPDAPTGEEKEKADPVLESSASILDQQSLPVHSEPVELASSVMDIPAIAETAHVQEAAALVEEFDAKEAEVPEVPMVKENEVEASVAEADAVVVKPDVAREAARGSAAPEVAAEEKVQFVQEKEVGLPLVASELVSEESEVPVVEENDAPASSLDSEVSTTEQRSLPVVSEPVDLAAPVADIPAIEEAALMGEAFPVEVSVSAEEALAEKVEDPETPVVEGKEIKAPVAALEKVKVEQQPVVLAPAQEGAAPGAEAPIAEPELTKEVRAKPSVSEAVEEDGDVGFPSAAPEPVTEEKETLVVAEDGGAAPTPVSEPLFGEEKSLLEEEAAPVEDTASVGEGVAEKGEESEAPVVDVKEIKAPMAALQETLSEESATPEAEAPISKVEMTQEAEVGPAASEVFAEEVQIMRDKVALPLVVSEPIVVEAPGVEEASIFTGLEPEAPVIADKSLPAEEAIQVQQPEPQVVEEKEADAHVAETSVEEEKVDEALEDEVLVNEPEVTKDAPPASIAAEESPDVQEVEIPLAVPRPISEEKEAPGVEESLSVPKVEHEAPVVAEKSLPMQEVQVEAAPVEETLVNKVGEPEASAVEKAEGADDAALHISSKVDSGTSSEATRVEAISSLDKTTIDGFESREHRSEDITRSEANAEFGRGGGHDRISSDLELLLNVEDPTAFYENLDQASQDRTVIVSNLELEDAPLISTSSYTAKLGERGNEGDEDIQKVEENFEKDKAVESHAEQDVFPKLKPLNVVQSRDSSHDEQAEESHSISSAPVQRRINFENVGTDEELNIEAPSSPSHGTDVQGANFVFKSRLGRDHRTHRHSAPDFLATETWVGEAPLYSPQDSFRGYKKAKYKNWPEFEGARPARTFSASVSDSAELHMGEFESLLQSCQERDKATRSPTTASPSGSPRPPAESGRQIREEISTIQKIIGQEIPPQYSLWKEVETLCQVVGMELPYMGDVSDLTKARHGLDLLKVVVGIK